MNTTERLDAALAQTRHVVAGVTPDQYEDPTPCTEWDVRALLNHLLGVMTMWAGLPAGNADMAALAGDHVGDEVLATYDALAREIMTAWSAPGVVENPVQFPGSEMPGDYAARMLSGDVVIHGWDLARATDQAVDWNQELAVDALAWHVEAVRRFPPELRAKSFGHEVPCPPDADAMSRLVAFVGRQPS